MSNVNNDKVSKVTQTLHYQGAKYQGLKQGVEDRLTQLDTELQSSRYMLIQSLFTHPAFFIPPTLSYFSCYAEMNYLD